MTSGEGQIWMFQKNLNWAQGWETTTWQAATQEFFWLNPPWFFSFLDAGCRNVDYEMEEYYHYSFHRGKIHGEATYVFIFQNAILFMEFYLRCWQSPKHSVASPKLDKYGHVRNAEEKEIFHFVQSIIRNTCQAICYW